MVQVRASGREGARPPILDRLEAELAGAFMVGAIQIGDDEIRAVVAGSVDGAHV
jgi:hypothetical protein